MENMEVLVRGLVMQNAGLGLGSVSFQGVQVLWVVVVATIVLALVSVTRTVSYVSVGWTWGSKPGQVRVRVQSFSSLLEDGIVTASGMFSAEILNCSADSCSEDASSSVSEPDAAEMVFFFEKKKNLLALPTQSSAPVRAAPEKIVRKRSKSLDFQKTESLQRSKSLDLQKIESLLLLSSQPIEVAVSRPIVLREGIVWDVSPPASLSACGESAKKQSLGNSAVYTAPPLPSRVVKNTSYEEWDPLLKLKIRDAVVSDGVSSFSVKDFTFPLAPVAIQGSGIAVLGNDVVRVWDSDTRSLMKCVRLPKRGNDAVTAFDVNWGLEALAMTRKGGLVSLVNLESAAHANCYETQQPVWQAVHLSSSPFSNILFTGGPAAANPGCFVALWDSRSSRRELTLDLPSARSIYGITSQTQELHVKDEPSSHAVYDMRMLNASTSLPKSPCEVTLSSTPEGRWWDMDTTLEEVDDVDDDDFMDCQTSEETKRATTSMSTLVTVMSRSFSSKTLLT
ncbi:hypothetical protein M758_6G040100 [Ceratodon purpureus]|nr:hypothetical protein M758_6G040100 [Ceratodon purpureus]